MPVLGHAFVGWVTALEIPPRAAHDDPPGRAEGVWIPALVTLAYAPDIAAQGALALGWVEASRATHSLALALVAAPLAGLALGFALGVRRWRAAVVTLVSVVLHDSLDFLQTPDRQPFWPLSHWHLGEEAAVIPGSGTKEALLFVSAFALYLVVTHLARDAPRHRRPGPHRLLTATLTATVMVAAGTTHHLRGVRERQLESARRLVGEGRFAEALVAAADAGRWPSTAHRGRVDQVRAEALEGLFDLEAAITAYSSAVTADPANFWAVADLAAACALSPRRDRSALASLLRAQLLRDFSGHPALEAALERIDRRMATQRP